MSQSSRKDYDDLLKESESSNRKLDAAKKGRIIIAPKRDTTRSEYDRLLNKAQRTQDDVTPKALRNKV
jgi:hypothetical protein